MAALLHSLALFCIFHFPSIKIITAPEEQTGKMIKAASLNLKSTPLKRIKNTNICPLSNSLSQSKTAKSSWKSCASNTLGPNKHRDMASIGTALTMEASIGKRGDGERERERVTEKSRQDWWAACQSLFWWAWSQNVATMSRNSVKGLIWKLLISCEPGQCTETSWSSSVSWTPVFVCLKLQRSVVKSTGSVCIGGVHTFYPQMLVLNCSAELTHYIT